MASTASNQDPLTEQFNNLNIAFPKSDNTKYPETKETPVKKKLTKDDFEFLDIIGRGAFAEVKIVRKKDSGAVYAMKIMNKAEMVNKNQVEHIRAERDVLVLVDSPWIVNLNFSFQDDQSLYLVMEYLQGGDLMSILIKKDILTIEQTRFYIAETALAIHSVHKCNYIHRDLKPDNILIDRYGHVKLSDFGLCKNVAGAKALYLEQYRDELNKDLRPDGCTDMSFANLKSSYKNRGRTLAYSTVGTPDYIAPEVFAQTGYDEGCDWWSLGVIMYECLVGYPPFYANDPRNTCNKILNFRKTLSFPREAYLPHAAVDLLLRLICEREHRLGFEEIRNHPFFHGIDWDNLHAMQPPIVPVVLSDTDNQNFDVFEENPEPNFTSHPIAPTMFQDYTYARPATKTTNLMDLFNPGQ